MDAIDALGELVKGEARGGRYFRRVATGNPKRPWKYFYSKEEYVQAHGEGAHLHGLDADKKYARPGEAVERRSSFEARQDAALAEVRRKREAEPHGASDYELSQIRGRPLREDEKRSYDDQILDAMPNEEWTKTPRTPEQIAASDKAGEEFMRDAALARKPIEGHHEADGKHYVDTAFMNRIGGAIPGMEMKHLGFGEFALEGPEGRIEFDRIRGQDFPGQSGRSHQMYDNKQGLLVKQLLYAMRRKNAEKSMDAIDALGCFFEKAKKPKKGARKPPYSEAQRRWAFAAEKRGELPEGDALKWSRRNAARKSEDESAQRGLYLGAEGERDSAVREMGALRAQPAYVQLEAGDDPFELLGKSLVSQARRQAYGDEGGLTTVAADCLYHGKDAAMLTGEAGAASGARCTCGE